MSDTTTALERPALVSDRVFAGVAEEVGEARRWVQAILNAWLGTGYAAAIDTCVLVVSELATNALLHTVSGERGGKFAVFIESNSTETAEVITIHVRDGGQPADDPGALRHEHDGRGHGLHLVSEFAHSVGRHAAADCGPSDKNDPTTAGRCSWAEFVIPLGGI